MAGKFPGRLVVVALALLRRFRRRPFDAATPYRRILIAHNLLLGDTLLLTPLLAKLRQRYPEADLWMTVSPTLVSLYHVKPYGVQVLPYHPRSIATLWSWLVMSGFDLAIVPGDNRYSWLARALGARCIVALSSDGHAWKDWQIDKQIPWPDKPQPLAEIFASLIDGARPPPYSPEQWPQLPTKQRLIRPENQPYCVLHVSARNSLRRWPVSHWQQLAAILRQRGWHIVWSAGPGEAGLVSEIEPQLQDAALPGTLDLPDLRHLLTGAKLLITVETGIAHLCRLTGTPSVVIFGQGNPALHGAEAFWQEASPMQAVFDETVSCRDQSHLFNRVLPWVRRCDRNPHSCARPVCIEALSPEQVIRAADILAGRQQRFIRTYK